MEAIIEFALMLLLDVLKTVALQWILLKFQQWWESRKIMLTPQAA